MSTSKKRKFIEDNLIISAVFHTAIILWVAFLAAREKAIWQDMKQLGSRW